MTAITSYPLTISDALTKDQVKAIKQADSVVFRFDAGNGSVRLTKEAKDATYGSAYDATMEIPITVGIIGKSQGANKACCVITSAQFAETWRTVAHLLKAGDKLSAEFQANYWRASEGYEDMNLDTCIVKINRNGAMMHFMVNVEMSRPGYSMRMIG